MEGGRGDLSPNEATAMSLRCYFMRNIYPRVTRIDDPLDAEK